MDVLGLPRHAALALLVVTATSVVPWLLPAASSPSAIATNVALGVLAAAVAGGLLGRVVGVLGGFAVAVSLVQSGLAPDGYDHAVLLVAHMAVGLSSGMLASARRHWRDEALAEHSRLRRVRRVAEAGDKRAAHQLVRQARWELIDELSLTRVRFVDDAPTPEMTVLSDARPNGGLVQRGPVDGGLQLPGELAVPVRNLGTVIGHLVLHAPQGQAITVGQLTFLRTVAAQVGAAVAMSPPWRLPGPDENTSLARMVAGRPGLDETGR